MCNNGVYAYAIRQARDKQGIARILKRIDKRIDKKLKGTVDCSKEACKTEHYEYKKPSSINFVDAPKTSSDPIIIILLIALGVMLVSLIYTLLHC